MVVDGCCVRDRRGLVVLRKEVGFVFQSFNPYPHMRVLDNITLAPMKVRHVRKAEAEKLAMSLLERVGIADQALKFPAALSGGSSSVRPSPEPWPWNQRSCCSMSPRAPWIPR